MHNDLSSCIPNLFLNPPPKNPFLPHQASGGSRKNIWGAGPLIIWDATTAKRNYCRTRTRKKLGGGLGKIWGPVPPAPNLEPPLHQAVPGLRSRVHGSMILLPAHLSIWWNGVTSVSWRHIEARDLLVSPPTRLPDHHGPAQLPTESEATNCQADADRMQLITRWQRHAIPFRKPPSKNWSYCLLS